jgi:hypothetical protein
MRLPTPFDPIEVGEIDNFAFDFTPDVGTTFIVFSSWTCRLGPYSYGSDPDSQSRVLDVQSQDTVPVRQQDGSMKQRSGAFSVARIGGMPASAAGGTYVLSAVAYLGDGRILALNSTVACKLPGQ